MQGGGLSISNSYNIMFDTLNIYNCHSLSQGGGIQIVNGINFQGDFSRIIFRNLNVKNNSAFTIGGGIYINQIDELLIQYSNIENNIIGNQEYLGGGMYLDNVQNLKIINSKFINNYYTAVYLNNIEKFVLKNSKFNNNFSVNKGGSLYLQDCDIISINQCQFVNNTVYFQKISPYNKGQSTMLSQGGSIYYTSSNNNQKKLQIQDTQIFSSQASSGGGIFIYKGLGQQLELVIKNIVFKDCEADVGSSIRFIGDFQAKDIKEIQQNVVSINSYQSLQNYTYFDINPVFYGYVYNEKVIDNYEFELCGKGTYIKEHQHYDTQKIHNQDTCDTCIEGGYCDGGYIPIQSIQGYYRQHIYDYELSYCILDKNLCLKNDTCKEGYTGPLCENCDLINNYVQKSYLNCQKCDSTTFEKIIS